MTQVTIDLPDTVSEQIEESGINQRQLSEIIARFVELYFQQIAQSNSINSFENSLHGSRKAGKGKHLNIIMSDDFDEPLEDFAEYMW
jgi:Protein of unknown function (DUF2281)